MAHEAPGEAGTGIPGAAAGDGGAVPARLRWRCRRGMRETDLLMLGWLERHWPGASPQARETFEALVEELDQDILAWILGREATPDRYASLIPCLAGLMSEGSRPGSGEAAAE